MDWVVTECGENTVWPPNVYKAKDYDDAVRIAQKIFDHYIESDIDHDLVYDDDLFLREEGRAELSYGDDEYIHINIVRLLEVDL